jgi:hypothetical protein
MERIVDELERQLLLAAGSTPIGKDLLEFPIEDLLSLGLALAARRLVIIVCDSQSAPKDIIPAARLIFQLNGKDVGGEDDPALNKEQAARISSELVQAQRRSEAAQ